MSEVNGPSGAFSYVITDSVPSAPAAESNKDASAFELVGVTPGPIPISDAENVTIAAWA